MDRCPSELWTRIFELACTDGGPTGCIIALVSRYFRESVLPVQFHSVALCGMKQMLSFARPLKKRELEPGHRLVRHLYISGRVKGNTILWSTPYIDLDPILFYILAAAAPSLRTLTMTLRRRAASERNVLDVVFPCLTELTLNGRSLIPPPRTSCPYDCFPSLRYLDMISGNASTALYTHHAPALTHLRLSGVADLERTFYNSLRTSLAGSGHPYKDLGAGRGRRLFPPTTQKITIQLAWEDGSNTLFCTNLARADKHAKLVFEGVHEHVYRAREDWEDRIMGGYGCWGEGAA